MKNVDTHKVALKFFDFDCSPEELTKQLGFELLHRAKAQEDKKDLALELLDASSGGQKEQALDWQPN